MCGLTGVVGTFDPRAIETMTDLLSHRGPDDRGTWLENTNGIPVMLGSRRLSIIDLSDAGHMPMVSADGRYIIAYNGEVYNHIELRSELEKEGEVFRSGSDTEVILVAYSKWGPDCLTRLNGMFAIAIWDRLEKSLFIARDRLGVKPLYYSCQGERFYFASEIKSFFGDPEFHSDVNRRAVGHFLALQYVPWPETAFQAVKKLPPGHYAYYADGKLRQTRYWCATDALGNDAPTAGQVAELLGDSVRLRLRSDVPVGLFLSGGIDSSIIASLSSSMTPHLSAFTVGFDSGGDRYDERSIAAETADSLSLQHQIVNCTEEQFSSLLPTLIWHLDEPIGENLMLPFFLLSTAARREFTVALSGEGADEAFYGYRYYTLEKLRRIAGRVGLNTLGKPFWNRLNKVDFADNVRLRALLYISRQSANSGFWSWSSAFFTQPQLAELVAPDIAREFGILDHMTSAAGIDRALSDLDVSPLYDLHFRMVDYLLTVRDKMTMAASLELRCPFLDYRVVEAGLATAAADKLSFRNTKLSLRQAVSGIVPAAVQKRKKKPFSSPVPYWLHGLVNRYLRNSECVRDGLMSRDAMDRWTVFDTNRRSIHPHKTFNLLVFELWYRIFITRSLSPEALPGTADGGAIKAWTQNHRRVVGNPG